MKATLSAFAAGLVFLVTACSTDTTSGRAPAADVEATDEAALIEAVLNAQAQAWNRGDIDAFMDGYWQSPDLRFASGGTVTRGYDQTLARYKARYSDQAAMASLSFTDLETVLLSTDAAVVHGHWQLTRASDAPSGLFTLVFRRMDGGWKIISDTTTSAD